MPFHTQQIGVDLSDEMRGSPDRSGQNIQAFVRLGRDGIGFRRTGIRGKAFKVTTIRYELTFVTARDLIDAYQVYRNSDPVNLVLNTVAMGLYQVLDVQQLGVQACTSVVESIVINPQVRQVVEWTLTA